MNHSRVDKRTYHRPLDFTELGRLSMSEYVLKQIVNYFYYSIELVCDFLWLYQALLSEIVMTQKNCLVVYTESQSQKFVYYTDTVDLQ